MVKRFFVCITIFYLFLFLFFIYQVNQASCQPLPAESPINAVIVATGQMGRIDAGMQLAGMIYPKAPLFISGVGHQVQIKDVIKIPLFEKRVILGKFAKNTKENGQEIAQWARNYHWQSIVVISHDYHLPRLLLHLDKIPGLTVYPYAVPSGMTSYFSWRFFIEMHKYYYARTAMHEI